MKDAVAKGNKEKIQQTIDALKNKGLRLNNFN